MSVAAKEAPVKGPAISRAERPSAQPMQAVPGGLSNQAVLQSLVRTGAGAGQAVGGLDDPEERAADALARQTIGGATAGPCACGGSCPNCRGRSGGGKPSGSLASGPALGAGRPLDRRSLAFFEPRLGSDLSQVRLHDDPAARLTARSLGARAFALGPNIAFADRAPSADSSAGRMVLAHELSHVALGHEGIRRLPMDGPMTDRFVQSQTSLAQRALAEARAKAHRHAVWGAAVEQRFHGELNRQPTDIAGERQRIDLGLTAQRGAVLDAVAGGEGWLKGALDTQGYSGPDIGQIKQAWAAALVAAELLSALAGVTEEVDVDARLNALATIPAYYEKLEPFARAAEQALATWTENENAKLSEEYARARAEYDRNREIDRQTVASVRGEPGASAFAGGLALARGAPPSPPTLHTPPASISGSVAAARGRAYAAETSTQWDEVAGDVRRLDVGLGRLLAATLPSSSSTRQALEYLEALNQRLGTFEAQHEVAVRIPAVFYPKDKMVSRETEEGAQEKVPETIPWQFYLVNTGVPSYDRPATSGGRWVLHDLTSGRGFKNDEPASDFDSAPFQQGEAVDPPLSLFNELNSRIRFPEGRLYFQLPSGTRYVLETTEPWSLSDFLAALGLVLAGIAIAASVVATGGGTAPAAIAFYAGLGATVAGVSSTIADLHEKSQHGILSDEDIDRAAVSIGLDLLSALTLGLGRIVSAPGAAARLGSRFLVLSRITQVARVGNLAGDVYQALTVTAGFVEAFRSIDKRTDLSPDERERMRAQLVRRALVTGAIMTVAIRGDIADVRAGGALHVTGVDSDGALIASRRSAGAETDAPQAHPDAPTVRPSAGAPHAEVTAPVHARAQEEGSGLTVGRQSHAVAAAGEGHYRDFYFCSDLCAPIVSRLEVVVSALPRGYFERAIVQDLLSRARGARARLRQGKLTQQQADDIARQISDDIERHSRHSVLFAGLMNTDPTWLAANALQVRRQIARDVDIQETHLGVQHVGQKSNRGVNRGRPDPTEGPATRSPLELDLLGGISIREADRASRRAQPLRFDVGNFSHTHAEALVPGLPRGLSKEVPVTLADGSVGRADRVHFIYDADGDRIGARVYEIKPNTPDNVARGQVQANDYMEGLQREIAEDLRRKGKTLPTSAPDGAPLFSSQVLTYDYDQMMAVLRALRSARADAASMTELEAIARQVFAAAGP